MRQTLRVGALAFIVVAAIFAFTNWGTDKVVPALATGATFAVVLFWLELRARKR